MQVLHQLVYLGVLDSIKVRHSGFGFRMSHIEFYKRFHMITPGVVSKYGKIPTEKDLSAAGTYIYIACIYI